jgi:hypothetical protein
MLNANAKARLCRAVLICAIAAPCAAYAVPQFNVTFTNDVVGSAPNDAPANPGGVSVDPTTVVAQPGTSVLVQNGYTDTLTGNTFGTGKVAVVTDTGGASTATILQGAVEDEITSGLFTVSFDWMEDKGVSPSTSSFFFGLTNQNRGKNLAAIFLDLGEDAGNIRSANDVNWGATLGTAARGVPHHIDWVVDLDQSDFSIATSLYLDGNFMHTQRREPFGASDGAPSFGAMTISSAGAATCVVALDNIRIQPGNALAQGWKGTSGDWHDAANWSGAIPNAVDAVANFEQTGSSNQTVYANSPVTIGKLRLNSGISYNITGGVPMTIQSAGTGTIEVLQGNEKINLPLIFASSSAVTVSPGATLTLANPTTISAGKTVTKSGNVVISAPLILEAGASIVNAAGPLSVFGAPSLAAGANVDLANNSLTVDYRGAADPVATVRQQLKDGYAAGAWNGDGISTSSSIAGQTGLGYSDSPAAQSVLVKYTYYGDTNLDGTVTSIDFTNLVASYGMTAGAGWGQGDFNYDDKVNTLDFNLLAGNFGASPLPGPGLGGVVPEPALAGLMMPLIGLAIRRRRRAR